ncbi:MAG: crossover junction endodeoxyribonuclease RuvC [Dehalococcoidales bacterium]|nr:crossover junction endodeoxyribonuclease RuvC [Dehalococcoidales bacterium]
MVDGSLPVDFEFVVIVLGIDPGTLATGYGIVESRNEEVALLDYGVLDCPAHSPIGERLSLLYHGLGQIILRYRPDAVAVEQPFVAKNVKSAFAIGRAQAVAILVAASRGIVVCEYTPTQVKQRVANYGASSKEQIQEMVRLHLGLSETPWPSDAADALAVALCHLSEVHLTDLLGDQR